ncbi:hypothetical protein N3K66_008608 [Trichothecium roseum]|uniref:Uncharacterized protein n=1 Tax=Trichothecium roseum TaxID=47278 RepID=A0ACC0UQU6_9HYPO|nr:hypothetical protein N3K66_008608 [Trichothecium roseum]
MFTTSPRLRIRRPSPTTAEFTVTTLPPSTTPLRILGAILGAARLVLSLTTLLVLHARWEDSGLAGPPPESFDSVLSADALRHGLLRLYASWPGTLVPRLAASLPAAALAVLAAALLGALSLRAHASESLLVLRGLGVQMSGSPGSYLVSRPTRFIPTEKIRDVLINEAFRGFEVRYYLVIVVEGEADLVVVFPTLLPRKAIVEEVWRGVRECLYEKSEG